MRRLHGRGAGRHQWRLHLQRQRRARGGARVRGHGGRQLIVRVEAAAARPDPRWHRGAGRCQLLAPDPRPQVPLPYKLHCLGGSERGLLWLSARYSRASNGVWRGCDRADFGPLRDWRLHRRSCHVCWHVRRRDACWSLGCGFRRPWGRCLRGCAPSRCWLGRPAAPAACHDDRDHRRARSERRRAALPFLW